MLVAAAALLGSVLHAVVSFARHVGAATFSGTWAWWYVLRPFTGVALALLVYFVIRGGLVTSAFGSDVLSPYGVAATAGLAGFFARQTTEKLEEVIKTVFGTASGAAVAMEPPTITALEPGSVAAGSSNTPVEVVGANFVRGTVVEVGGSALGTEFEDAGRLRVVVDAARLAKPGLVDFVAVNPGPRGSRSDPAQMRVTPT